MSCQCFQIGGPFIEEDPNCLIHGREAQNHENELDELRYEVQQLKLQNASLLKRIEELEKK